MSARSPGSNGVRPLLVALLGAGIATFFLAGGSRLLSFEQLVSHKEALIAWTDARPVLAPTVWVLSYLALGLFGLPGSTVLNLAAGLLFDFREGLLLVVTTSTLASSLAFASFRYLFRDFVEAKARRRFPAVVEGLEREGLYFVFTLRLLPVIPYSATNLVLAISPVRFWPCLVVSLVGLLPRYVLYAYAGSHLGNVERVEDLWSPRLVGALAALAAVPWLVHLAARRRKR